MQIRCSSLFASALAILTAACGPEVDVQEHVASSGDNLVVINLTNNWHPLGPTLIHDGQAYGARVPVTGRLTVVASNPLNHSDVWLGAASGGVWHGDLLADNAWTLENPTGAAAIGAIRLEPSTCNSTRCSEVWVGTGEDAIRRDTQYGEGVYHGSWGGTSYAWAGPLGNDHFSKGSIAAMVLDPTTSGPSKRLYLALSSGVSSNTTQASVATTPAGSYGIWKSSDAGATWVNKLPVSTPATDIQIDPTSPNVLWAAVSKDTFGIYRSPDYGESWVAASTNIPGSVLTTADWPKLAVYHSGSTLRLYAMLGTCSNAFNPGVFCVPNLYKSTDGTTWTLAWSPSGQLSYGDPLTMYTPYTHAIAIHPSQPDTLWIGGVNVYKSTHGGAAPWSVIGAGMAHMDHHDLEVFPFESGVKVYDVNDGGFVTGDGVAKWNADHNKGLMVTQVQSVARLPLSFSTLIGTQDNGTNVSFGQSGLWGHRDDGDSSFTFQDSDLPARGYDVNPGPPPRFCDSGFMFYCNFNWPTLTNPVTQVGEGFTFFPPFIEDPNGSGGQHPLYFASERLYKSSNDGASWGEITPNASLFAPLGGSTYFPLINTNNPITAVAVAPTNSNRIYIGYYDGKVFTTAVGGGDPSAWPNITAGLPGRPVNAIAVSPIDESTAFIAFGGFGTDSIYKTTSAGANWAAFDASDDGSVLATNPANALAIETASPYQMWAGTNIGVYGRVGMGDAGNWQKVNLGRTLAVYDLKLDNVEGLAYAATHGGGVWAGSNAPLISVYADVCCGYIDRFDPAPFVSLSASQFDAGQSCTMTVYDASGSACAPATAVDAYGATLSTDAYGMLVATKSGYYTSRATAWACYDGTCAGGVPISRCKATSVNVTCGRRAITGAVHHMISGTSPPSTALGLPSVPTGSGSFTLSPTLKTNDGTTHALCSVTTSFSVGQDATTILTNARDAINASTQCSSAGVRASISPAVIPGAHEDEAPVPTLLELSAPAQTGVQLFTSVTAPPGVELMIRDIGDQAAGSVVVPRLTFSGTASGGNVSVLEQSAVGSCKKTVAISARSSASTVAANVQAAFLAPPGTPTVDVVPGCLNIQNARDVSLNGAALRFSVGAGLSVLNTDPGLSFTIDTE